MLEAIEVRSFGLRKDCRMSELAEVAGEVRMARAIGSLSLRERQALQDAANSPEPAGASVSREVRAVAIECEIVYRSTGRLRPHALKLLRNQY